MSTLAVILVVAMAAGVGVGMARSIQRRQDAERQRAERAHDAERQRAAASERARAAAVQLASLYFPFLSGTLEGGQKEGDPMARIKKALEGIESIDLGQASIGFPAILPLAERRKHLVVLGKSGFGKTTIALRLLRDDLIQGRGICVLGSEAELYRDWLLPLVPSARDRDVILFRPSDPRCTLTWNPLNIDAGDDRALAAGELFAIFKRAIGESSIGARADAILSSAFSVLMARPGATLWSVARLLQDDQFRAEVVEETSDPYLKEFWTKTFPAYPPNAGLPIANRLNQFLRMPQVRAALCHPVSSFSIREALATSKVLMFDLSGLDPDATRLLGQMLLSKFQIELMRREKVSEEQRAPVHVYVDEFHVFATSSEGTWRELLSRGRRYGLGLHLLSQHPHQLPKDLQHEIFGNVSSLVALNLAAGEAATVRRELLAPGDDNSRKPIAAEAFVSLPVGEGYARLGSGACALKVKFAPPIKRPDVNVGERVRDLSWKTYAAPPAAAEAAVSQSAGDSGNGARNRGRRPNLATSPTSEEWPGRGGHQHKLLQQLARQLGEERGFKVTLEENILGGAGRVDVVLVRGEGRIAIEVAITSSPQQMATSVGRALAAGFAHVVVLTRDKAAALVTGPQFAGVVGAGDRDKVHQLTLEELGRFLDRLPGGTGAVQPVAGYSVAVSHETPAGGGPVTRRRTLARVVGAALLRRRWSS